MPMAVPQLGVAATAVRMQPSCIAQDLPTQLSVVELALSFAVIASAAENQWARARARRTRARARAAWLAALIAVDVACKLLGTHVVRVAAQRDAACSDAYVLVYGNVVAFWIFVGALVLRATIHPVAFVNRIRQSLHAMGEARSHRSTPRAALPSVVVHAAGCAAGAPTDRLTRGACGGARGRRDGEHQPDGQRAAAFAGAHVARRAAGRRGLLPARAGHGHDAGAVRPVGRRACGGRHRGVRAERPQRRLSGRLRRSFGRVCDRRVVGGGAAGGTRGGEPHQLSPLQPAPAAAVAVLRRLLRRARRRDGAGGGESALREAAVEHARRVLRRVLAVRADDAGG